MQTLTPFQQLYEVIPGGVNSPARSFPGLGLEPLVVQSAINDRLIDSTGKSWIDFCCSWGALILGHSPPEVVSAVQAQLHRGTSFGMTSLHEEAVAREVIRHLPSVELVRFVSSGTEAAMSAVRLARAFTGRELILKFNGNYHGHSDGFLVQAGSGVTRLSATSSSAGVSAQTVATTLSLPYNDENAINEAFDRHEQQIAAVIVEPVAGNMGVVPATPELLQLLRKRCSDSGALLIFDEVISGFRVALGGAQSLYGIRPDLTCLGKIIGGGFPVAAFGGRRDVMEMLAPIGPVYQAGTLSGNAVAMVAAKATLEAVTGEGFYEELQRRADRLCAPIERCIEKHGLPACVQRVGSMWSLFLGRRQVSSMEEAKACDFAAFRALYRALYSEGAFLSPSPFESSFIGRCHDNETLDQTSNLICRTLKRLMC